MSKETIDIFHCIKITRDFDRNQTLYSVALKKIIMDLKNRKKQRQEYHAASEKSKKTRNATRQRCGYSTQVTVKTSNKKKIT